MGMLSVAEIDAQADALISAIEANIRLLTRQIDVLVVIPNRTKAQQAELDRLRTGRSDARHTIARLLEEELEAIDSSDEVRDLIRNIKETVIRLGKVSAHIAHIAETAETVTKVAQGADKLIAKLKSEIGDQA